MFLNVFISVVGAEKRLDISHKNHWSGGPAEGRVCSTGPLAVSAVRDHGTRGSFEPGTAYHTGQQQPTVSCEATAPLPCTAVAR